MRSSDDGEERRWCDGAASEAKGLSEHLRREAWERQDDALLGTGTFGGEEEGPESLPSDKERRLSQLGEEGEGIQVLRAS